MTRRTGGMAYLSGGATVLGLNPLQDGRLYGGVRHFCNRSPYGALQMTFRHPLPLPLLQQGTQVSPTNGVSISQRAHKR
ncbi:MAG: hypothetical protein ACE5MM_00915, partial [Nitrospiraceae bacterium]